MLRAAAAWGAPSTAGSADLEQTQAGGGARDGGGARSGAGAGPGRGRGETGRGHELRAKPAPRPLNPRSALSRSCGTRSSSKATHARRKPTRAVGARQPQAPAPPRPGGHGHTMLAELPPRQGLNQRRPLFPAPPTKAGFTPTSLVLMRADKAFSLWCLRPGPHPPCYSNGPALAWRSC